MSDRRAVIYEALLGVEAQPFDLALDPVEAQAITDRILAGLGPDPQPVIDAARGYLDQHTLVALQKLEDALVALEAKVASDG